VRAWVEYTCTHKNTLHHTYIYTQNFPHAHTHTHTAPTDASSALTVECVMGFQHIHTHTYHHIHYTLHTTPYTLHLPMPEVVSLWMHATCVMGLPVLLAMACCTATMSGCVWVCVCDMGIISMLMYTNAHRNVPRALHAHTSRHRHADRETHTRT
jgi:hypothetical protein